MFLKVGERSKDLQAVWTGLWAEPPASWPLLVLTALSLSYISLPQVLEAVVDFPTTWSERLVRAKQKQRVDSVTCFTGAPCHVQSSDV